MKNFLLLTTLLFFTFGSIAQKSDKKALKEEVEAYMDEQIVPQLILRQDQFMMYLTDEEEKKIVEFKEKISRSQKQREAQQGNNQQRMQGKKGGRHKGQDRSHQNMQNGAAEMHKEVAEITDAHPEAVKNYQGFIDSNKDQWLTDLKAIRDKYDLDQQKSDQQRLENQSKMFDKLADPVWLLLWDPSQQLFRKMMSRRMGDRNSEHPEISNELKVSLFPNPANINTTIRLEKPAPKNVDISLFSKDGERIQEIFSGLVDEETIVLKVSTIDLEDGIYFIKVFTEEISLTQKLIVQH